VINAKRKQQLFLIQTGCGLQEDIRNKISNYRFLKSAKPPESLSLPTTVYTDSIDNIGAFR
jgi:hypothetical protein